MLFRSNLLDVPKNLTAYVNYRLLVELCKIFREQRSERVLKKLKEYGTIKESSPELEELIKLAGSYADDFDKPSKVEIQLDEKTRNGLKQLIDLLLSETEQTDIQNSIYQIARNCDVQPRDFFKVLYQIILASDRGPKIGPFIIDIDRKKVAQTLSQYL